MHVFSWGFIQLELWGLKQFKIENLIYLADILASTQFEVDDPIFEVIPELHIPDQFPSKSAFADAWLPSYSDEPPLLDDQLHDLVHIPASRNIVLHPT